MPEPSSDTRIGRPFIELLSVDSTNNYALTAVRAGLAQHGAAFFAHEQLAGKGQRGKSWTTSPDSSLILSVVVDPRPLAIGQQFQLSACIGLAGVALLREYAGDEVTIKWPNDLYWRDRKAGGILIENIIGAKTAQAGSTNSDSAYGEWQWAIVGIGINLNQEYFPSDLKNAVSLKQITSKNFDPASLARELCQWVDIYFNQLVSKGFAGIYDEYLSKLYKRGQIVKMKKGSRVFDALIKSVLPNGRLVIEHGIEESLDLGEVEWILPTEK